MDSVSIRQLLLYCTLINFGLLAIWAVLFVLPHQWLYRLQGRIFRVSPEQFDAINASGIVLYKIAIYLFNLAPYLALCILG
jgi:hypothetical protein